MQPRPGADRVDVNGLRVMSVIGVLPHEREAAQPLRIDLSMHVDLLDASRSDDLAETVDYGAVTEAVAELARTSSDVLLERLAGRIADACLGMKRVEAVDVTVTKLRPPIPEPVESSAVRLHRRLGDLRRGDGAHLALVAVGSNLGDRVAHLRHAVTALAPSRCSRVYETAPIGGPEAQGPYLNMVMEVATDLDPFALLRRLLRVEAEVGRERSVHWGPRTLDLDLLFHDDAVVDSADLVVPHPRYAQRRFVLAPLSELAPDRCPEGWQDELPPDPVEPIGRLEEL